MVDGGRDWGFVTTWNVEKAVGGRKDVSTEEECLGYCASLEILLRSLVFRRVRATKGLGTVLEAT